MTFCKSFIALELFKLENRQKAKYARGDHIHGIKAFFGGLQKI